MLNRLWLSLAQITAGFSALTGGGHEFIGKNISDSSLLPESKQLEVLDFTEYLNSKTEIEENRKWSNFSVVTVMKDTKNESSNYSLTDLKETF